jgi:hypothetical protein
MEYRKEIIRQCVDGVEMETEVLLPALELPEWKPVGLYGRRYQTYIKECCRPLYYSLLTSGKLNERLIEVDAWAKDFMERVTRQMAKQEGVTEKLKAEDMLAWVGRMNNIKSRAEEMMYDQLYTM